MPNISKIKDDDTGIVYDIEDTVARSRAGVLSSAVKTALLNCFENVAWINADGQTYYDALYDALYPPATLVSISAVYSGGSIYSDQSLDSLRDDLVVTANFDDYSTRTVTTYTLSGTLVQGTSTITVSYDGKTTTFNVTVIGGRFSLAYAGNFTTSTPSSTRYTLITSELTLEYGQTLTLSVASGYKIYPITEYGAGSDRSASRTAKAANQIYIYAVNNTSGHVYATNEYACAGGTPTGVKYTPTTWVTGAGSIAYSIYNSAISSITFDGIAFYIEKTSGTSITESEAKDAVSWTIS